MERRLHCRVVESHVELGVAAARLGRQSAHDRQVDARERQRGANLALLERLRVAVQRPLLVQLDARIVVVAARERELRILKTWASPRKRIVPDYLGNGGRRYENTGIPELQGDQAAAALGYAYFVLTDHTAIGSDSIEFTADGCEARIADARDDALKAHAASVSAADVVLRYSKQVCETKQRVRIQIDYLLALVVLFLRDRPAIAPAGRRGADGSASAARAAAQQGWCARSPLRTARLRTAHITINRLTRLVPLAAPARCPSPPAARRVAGMMSSRATRRPS